MEQEPQIFPTVEYPFMPEGRKFKYVPENDPFIIAAKEWAREHSLDTTMPTASVIVVEGEIVGRGANGSDYHKTHECERVKLGIPTGQGYELCEGCHPKNHSEPRAIADAKEKNVDLDAAELYLWGHWWCCQDCWAAIEQSGIKQVYVMEGSEIKFNKDNPNNVVGRQFNEE